MQKPTAKEIKKELESPRGQLRLIVMSFAFVAIGVAAFVIIFFDPFGGFAGTPAVHEAKKWIAICICFIWLPVLAGVWFMVIRPLQTGIATDTRRYSTSFYVVTRAEEPGKFRAQLWCNILILIAALVIAVWTLSGFIRDLQKAKAELPRRSEGAGTRAD